MYFDTKNVELEHDALVTNAISAAGKIEVTDGEKENSLLQICVSAPKSSYIFLFAFFTFFSTPSPLCRSFL